MAWTQVPTRNTSDPNASADINQLQDNADALKGGTPASAPTTTIEDLADDSGLVKASDTDTDPGSLTDKLRAGFNITLALVTTGTGGEQEVEISSTGGGGGSTEMNPMYPAGSFDYPTSNPAPLDTDSGTNGTIKRQLFDDSTDESVIGQFKVPSDIYTSGTVTFRMYGYAVTAASANVVFDFKHSAVGDSDSWDTAFTTESSGAKAVDTVQDEIDVFTWTETVSNLGWSASDFCRFQLTRDADNGSDTLSGDYGVIFFEIDIPRA